MADVQFIAAFDSALGYTLFLFSLMNGTFHRLRNYDITTGQRTEYIIIIRSPDHSQQILCFSCFTAELFAIQTLISQMTDRCTAVSGWVLGVAQKLTQIFRPPLM